VEIKKISYIVPCYNEEEVIHEFYTRVTAVSQEFNTYDFEFIFVNDGSSDKTPKTLDELAAGDNRVKVLHLAINRGHQAAITAGMDFSTGDLIVIIDADLQDPPELVKEMIEKVHEGFDVVHAQRKSRKGESGFKLFTAWFFYKMMRKLTANNLIENSGDFRAFTRPVLKVVRGFREERRFMRGIFSMVGFRQCVIQYDRGTRHAGKTKYPFKKMSRLAINAVLSFSRSPLKVISWLSFLMWFSSLVYLMKALIEHFVYRATVPGWTSIIILMTFFTGIIIFCLSIIASYIGRIFEQGQHRPIYWLSDARNIDMVDTDSDILEVKLSKDIFKQ
jgi:dolichol-phosphate mannosyltransferase